MRHAACFSALVLVGAGAACGSEVDVFGNASAASSGAGGGTPGATTGADATGSSSTGPTTSSSASGPSTTVGPGSGGGPPVCDPEPDEDADGDGFSQIEGDCDDCDPTVSPGHVEVIGVAPPKDDDCDGSLDNLPLPCDDAFAIDDPSPMNAARALELCKLSSGPGDHGLVAANWVMADGSPPPAGPPLANFHLGHGLLGGFGPNVKPRAGLRLLALSSGAARAPGDPGYQSTLNKGYPGAHPQGFPKVLPNCPGVTTGNPNDPTALEVVVRTPSNATGFAFDLDLYTGEWPAYVCNTFNDLSVAILSPIPAGQTDGNVTMDSLGAPISVSTPLIDVCGCMSGPPCMAGGQAYACSQGTAQLMGTGFENGGATGWLTTTVPVGPGTEIVMRWGVYDSGDGAIDTATLVDGWRWLTEAGVTVSTTPTP